jgi:hypothetical protein
VWGGDPCGRLRAPQVLGMTGGDPCGRPQTLNLCGQCGKLIHRNCGNVSDWMPFIYVMWTMWKTYPLKMWKSGRENASHVDNVENLSTEIVEK